MLRLFVPNEHVKSIYDIDPIALKKRGIKGIVTDLDNTLVEWDRSEVPSALMEWFQKVKENGIIVTIVSNNSEERVGQFSSNLAVDYIHRAKKPLGRAFRKAIQKMKLKKEEVIVIGDQLLTDILGGNRSGLYTILVAPVAQSDGFFTRMNRRLEKTILYWMKRKGLVYWEE